MRTNNEITKEINCLRNLQEMIPETSFFGDNNIDAIDAQIKVLSEKLDEDEIYEMWQDEEYLRSSAEQALEWLNGEDCLPSDDWKTLIKK